MEYISFNQEIIVKESLGFYDVERFRVADAYFESILSNNSEFPLLHLHEKRIKEAAKLFGFKYKPIDEDHLKALLLKNGLDKDFAKIRISFVRKNGANYKPSGNENQVLVETLPVLDVFTPVPKLGLYLDNQKFANEFSRLKSANALLYVLARKFANEKKLDEVLISNEEGKWIEASSSNIFIVKNNTLYTPNLKSGGVHGVCLDFLINFFEVNFVDFDDEMLSLADEIFLSNAVQLIQPVKELRGKRLKTTKTKKLIKALQKELKI